jgi:diguanylate cyclase (GGDEF)-like protein/PAS domain S-box-containing protein
MREGAESRLAHTRSNPAPAESAEALLHELQVHQIELEAQNEALHEAQVALEESLDRYSDLYEFAPVGYLTLTDTGHIAEINLTGATMLGEERGTLLNSRFARFVAAEDGDRWHLFLVSAMQQHDLRNCELTLRRGDGSCFNASLNWALSAIANKAPQVRMTLSDITERKRAEEELRIAAMAFELQEGIMVTDPKGIIIRVNRAFSDLTGYSAEEALGQTPALLSSGHHEPAFYQQLWQALKQTGKWQGEIWNRHKNGRIYAEWLSISAVKAPDGTTTHYIGSYSEVTTNREAEAEIHRLAYYDPLTQLPNRRLLQDRIGQALAANRRSGNYGALMFIDLDNFKILNDTRGHEIGDQLLIAVALRIHANVRAHDTVARLGGDEFVVMLEDLSTDARDAAMQTGLVGEKLRQALAQPYDLGEAALQCTASLGVALFGGRDESVDTVLKHADLAMYKAKRAGRNSLCFFDSVMHTPLG